mgnify:FL=1
MSQSNQTYKTSFTSGGLFQNECVELAVSYLETNDWNTTISQLKADGLTSSPKEKSKHRILREIVNRLQTLSETELYFLVEETDRRDQALLIWLSICRAYRLIREFTLEIVQDRYLAYQLELPPSSFDLFFEHKAEWDDTLASTSASTRVRLRQVLFKIMREVGIISEDNRIQTTYLSASLRRLIEEEMPTDLAVFPGIVIARPLT